MCDESTGAGFQRGCELQGVGQLQPVLRTQLRGQRQLAALRREDASFRLIKISAD